MNFCGGGGGVCSEVEHVEEVEEEEESNAENTVFLRRAVERDEASLRWLL